MIMPIRFNDTHKATEAMGNHDFLGYDTSDLSVFPLKDKINYSAYRATFPKIMKLIISVFVFSL